MPGARGLESDGVSPPLAEAAAGDALPAPPPLALSDEERAAVLAELHAERFVDASPAAVYATLLDEGTYLASEPTMYRVLAANQEVRERRTQLRHRAYATPSSWRPGRTSCGAGTSRS